MSSVGIDVGGTFTDLVAVDAEGRIAARKVPSTPADQSEGVLAALEALGGRLEALGRIVHGTTVATNTLLERTGARVALCATAGVTDLLELRRQDRASLYDLRLAHPAPLVPPERTIAIDERVAPDGVVRPLAADAGERAADAARRMGAEAVAVALLHSYERPDHERTLGARLRERLAGVDIVLSSEVHPEIREYERTATTVAEAYLRPRVGAYLSRLGAAVRDRGGPAPSVMTSGGGTRTIEGAARNAAALALSGPAGGVAGAAAVARAAGIDTALTFDIGGTSADAGLILDGAPLVEPGGSVAGVPIALPRVLVETVSAGGGSIGWIDAGGALRVGPRSAGIAPGPAAFGRGHDATVTDAHVVLGHLRGAMLGGGITLDAAAARRALGLLARPLGRPVERVAEAMIAIADAAMARALRRVSVERGVDPRDAALIAFGGGGPLHGCGLAEQLGMTRVLVPPFAGVLSALGLAIAPESASAAASVMRPATALDAEAVARMRAELEAAARSGASREGRPRWWGRVRYAGQGHELDVELADGDDGVAIADRFAVEHARRYGFTLARPVEVVSARCVIAGATRPIALERAPRPGGGRGGDEFAGIDDGGSLDARVPGPAVIALPDATLRVGDGWVARALRQGGWLLERGG